MLYWDSASSHDPQGGRRPAERCTGHLVAALILLRPPPAAGKKLQYSTFGAACTEVEVNLLTGERRVLRADVLHDAGRLHLARGRHGPGTRMLRGPADVCLRAMSQGRENRAVRIAGLVVIVLAMR